jgi:hypothetical protein
LLSLCAECLTAFVPDRNISEESRVLFSRALLSSIKSWLRQRSHFEQQYILLRTEIMPWPAFVDLMRIV